MLSFDEFRAVSNREKNRAETAKRVQQQTQQRKTLKKDPSKASAGSAKQDDNNDKKKKPETSMNIISRAIAAIGDFLEVHQMQALYVLMIVLDTFASLAEICLSCGGDFSLKNSMLTRKSLVRMLGSFTTFASLFFAMEIVLVVMVFGRKLFSHWGYIIDVFNTAGQFYIEYHGYGKASRLLNIFRFWRMLRLVGAMVVIEKDAHDRTQEKLDSSEEESKKLQLAVANLRSDIVREKEARDAIEAMLMNYKEEVDTLNEALKIAAMDIAEVAQADEDFELSEDDTEDDGEDHEDAAATAAAIDEVGGKYSKAGNKSAVMRAVMEDASTRSRGSAGSNTSSSMATGRSGPPTFLIHEDGTFEQK